MPCALMGKLPPNLIVISFDLSVSNKSDLQLSSEKQLFALSDRILRIDQTERRLLALIIQEAKQSFDCRLDDPYLAAMPTLSKLCRLAADSSFAYIWKNFLLHLLRRFEHAQSIGLDKKPASYKLKNTEEILDLITNYLKQHIHEQITLEQICHDNLNWTYAAAKAYERAV